jgi:hypothetical protein
MWDAKYLTSLFASMAYYGDSFTFLIFTILKQAYAITFLSPCVRIPRNNIFIPEQPI